MLKIEIMSIKEIVPYENNAKEHPKEQVAQIVKSIEEFGFNDPIAIDSNNVIIEGHGRLLAAESMQMKEVPVIRLDHLSDMQRRAYILAHNKLTMNSGFDMDVLSAEMKSLDEFDFDLELTGFSFDEIDDLELLMDGEEEEKEDGAADFVPATVEVPVIKRGDLIEMGLHKLLCGSATEEDDVLKLMGGELADQLVTDPPYNVEYVGKTKEAMTIQNDSMDNDSFRQFLRDAFKNANSVMKEGGVFYIWHADSEGYNFRGACFDIGWKVRQCLIWKKQTLVMGRQDYHWKHEPCLYGWKEGAGHLWATDRKQTTILEFNRPSKSDLHPTMKPVDLIEYNITNNTKGRDIVLDLFLGSGTTLIACENTKRRCMGTELDEKYAQVIVQRWCDYTSIDTIKINGVECSWSEYKNANKTA